MDGDNCTISMVAMAKVTVCAKVNAVICHNSGFNFMILEGSNITGKGVRFDELNLGETLGDVVQSVPEPATASLLLLGGAAMFARRRRA